MSQLLEKWQQKLGVHFQSRR